MKTDPDDVDSQDLPESESRGGPSEDTESTSSSSSSTSSSDSDDTDQVEGTQDSGWKPNKIELILNKTQAIRQDNDRLLNRICEVIQRLATSI